MQNLGAIWFNYEEHIDRVKHGQLADAVANWAVAVENIINTNRDIMNLNHVKMTVKKGRRFYKVITDSYVYAFINMENGDILKPASWAAPAKHARGNVFDKESWKNCGPYGVVYLK